jgi:hypothetical protein
MSREIFAEGANCINRRHGQEESPGVQSYLTPTPLPAGEGGSFRLFLGFPGSAGIARDSAPRHQARPGAGARPRTPICATAWRKRRKRTQPQIVSKRQSPGFASSPGPLSPRPSRTRGWGEGEQGSRAGSPAYAEEAARRGLFIVRLSDRRSPTPVPPAARRRRARRPSLMGGLMKGGSEGRNGVPSRSPRTGIRAPCDAHVPLSQTRKRPWPRGARRGLMTPAGDSAIILAS